ncbi:MAG TPA: GntR family transcriptional regulator [Propylenella sp.]|nr:GntR family transcriptional regulator [Propylenella sp.]
MKFAELVRNSDTPLYRQLANLLEREIRSGTLPSGSKLPSEKSLMQGFGVSRHVVRLALAEVAKAGLIDQQHGSGSFVNPQKVARSVAAMTGFTENGLQLTHLGKGVVQVSQEVARRLRLPSGSSALRLERVGLIEHRPTALIEILLPLEVFPDLLEGGFSDESLPRAAMQHHGIQATRSENFIDATIASEREAEILGTKAGALLLVLEGIAYDQKDRPVEYSRSVHRNDRLKFYFEIFSTRPL